MSIYYYMTDADGALWRISYSDRKRIVRLENSCAIEVAFPLPHALSRNAPAGRRTDGELSRSASNRRRALLIMIQDYSTVSGASTNVEFPAWQTVGCREASLVLSLEGRWSVPLGLFTNVWR